MNDAEPTPSVRARSREDVADYLVEIGSLLAASGCPSYRLEDVLRLIADVEGHRADPFALAAGQSCTVRIGTLKVAPPPGLSNPTAPQ